MLRVVFMFRGQAVYLSVPTLQAEVKPWAGRPHPRGICPHQPHLWESWEIKHGHTPAEAHRTPHPSAQSFIDKPQEQAGRNRPLGKRRSQEKGDQDKHRTVLPKGNSQFREEKRTLKDWIHILREMREGIAVIKKQNKLYWKKKKRGKEYKRVSGN